MVTTVGIWRRGIGAEKNWDACLLAYQGSTVDPKAQRDIIWRSRSTKTPQLLADLIRSKSTPTEELPRLFRGFDFQASTPAKDEVLVKLALSGPDVDAARVSIIASESINRIKSFDFKTQPAAMKIVNEILDRSKGTGAFVDMVDKFNVPGANWIFW